MHPRLINCALKNLESPYLYSFRADERYELDTESFAFLKYCTGKNSFEDILNYTGSSEKEAKALLDYLTSEGCAEDREDQGAPDFFNVQEPVFPSLRYLQLHITEICNLDCGHCYLGKKKQKDIGIDVVKKVLEEFSPNGLKLLITGGEPLLHRRFWDILELASRYLIRIELLTNGTLISEDVAEKLSRYVHGVQISLDGMEAGHESLRGSGSFKKALKGIGNAKKYVPVNIATMVHSHNLEEFAEMSKMVSRMGAAEWNLDVPALAGNAVESIIPSMDAAAEIFKKYGFGMGVHEGDKGYSCGSHICTVDVEGGVSKCGFFEETIGNIKEENLMDLWDRVVKKYTPTVDALECMGCAEIEICRGGCRYRANVSGDFYGKDPFMCTIHLGPQR